MSFVTIHGHFYQPARENPWTGEVDQEGSAAPLHDWNERVCAECYAPNAHARLLGPDERTVAEVNNYERISFNFGPTLLSWLERRAPETYQAILAADRIGRKHFSGHGPAIAQMYNHTIAPLDTDRDRRTQAVWAVRDFEHRFGRKPEGIWLAETAADLKTLEVLAGLGIRFTILAPHQAKAVRRIDGIHPHPSLSLKGEEIERTGNHPLPPPQGGGNEREGVADNQWQPVEAGTLDTRRPYLLRLPSDRSISLFFYDAALAHEVAFAGLLKDGRAFADRLQAQGHESHPQITQITQIGSGEESGESVKSVDEESGSELRLSLVATDGETYGHHHKFGEMALAACLARLRSQGARLTVPAEFLKLCPPQHEVLIHENTSWSCPHGIERWRGDCGCSTGGHPGWNQEWRAPLREAMDWLRDRLAEVYEREASRFLRDPWQARDDYIEVLFDRSRPGGAGHNRNPPGISDCVPSPTLGQFLAERMRPNAPDLGHDPISPSGNRPCPRPGSLLEMQRFMMLALSSDGWFFDDISEPTGIQVMRCACRAIELCRELTGLDLEPEYLRILGQALSNIPALGTGSDVYRRFAARRKA